MPRPRWRLEEVGEEDGRGSTERAKGDGSAAECEAAARGRRTMKQARLTPAEWRAEQTPDTGRGRPDIDAAEAVWRMLTAADASLRIESFLPPARSAAAVARRADRESRADGQQVLVVVMATAVDAGRRQDPVTLRLALEVGFALGGVRSIERRRSPG